jgi:hypothetical protein
VLEHARVCISSTITTSCGRLFGMQILYSGAHNG